MQLDDDSLLTLFNMYDPEGTGYLQYEHLMSLLLDPDYFALYIGGNIKTNNSKIKNENSMTKNTEFKVKLAKIEKEDLMDIMKKFDKEGKGYLRKKDFISACAVLGIALAPEDLPPAETLTTTSDHVNYIELLN